MGQFANTVMNPKRRERFPDMKNIIGHHKAPRPSEEITFEGRGHLGKTHKTRFF